MDELYLKAEEKMNKTIAAMQSEFSTIRAGRASSAVLERVMVEYYGVPTPINQLASISVMEARTLQIQPYDATSLRSIEKAIQVSDIGINPQNDGKVLRLNFPPLTEERRRELTKVVSKMAEDAKIAVRSIRRDIIEKYKTQKKNAEITEDDLKTAEQDIQKLTDKFCALIDKETERKTAEITEI